MSGPAKVPAWDKIAEAFTAPGCSLTEYGRSLLHTPESPAEDCRNALSIIVGRRGLALESADIEAIEARLWSAVRKLEAA